MERFYPIGSPGQPWGSAEVHEWFDAQVVQRSYRDDVVERLRRLERNADAIDLVRYGALPVDPDRYQLFGVTISSTSRNAPWVLVTGGVHGYETSGVHGALAFLENEALSYREQLNIVVAPCVSPWGYEVINRWNPNAVDPNRSFRVGGQSEEASYLSEFVGNVAADFAMHIDLHETTDTDESEFRPAVAARDGVAFVPGTIPDGFYAVGDSQNPQPDFQAAIVSAVETVTHIAEADEDGRLIGSDMVQRGVINYDFADWGLCPSVTTASLTSTTEVYPDSPRATDEICVAAQVTAVRSAIAFLLDDVG